MPISANFSARALVGCLAVALWSRPGPAGAGPASPGLDGAAQPSTGLAIVPRPLRITAGTGSFELSRRTIITVKPSTPELQAVGRYLADLLEPAMGWKLPVRSPWFSGSAGVRLELDQSKQRLGAEGYELKCTGKGVIITAAAPAGLFYGVQTLRQLLPVNTESRQPTVGVAWTVPCVTIEDKPRFAWRGYLIDTARHFRTKDELKRLIDLLALHKLNRMQLHLTDDQGWRVEIKKYPKLLEIGSRLPDYGGQKGEGWFYLQADIKELVAYAASRYVTLVPEIEMPGHSGAALSSYPELACGGKRAGGWSVPLCVSRESALDFATNVLDEVLALFPSPYIHVGADEVPAGPWRNCASCKAAMTQLEKVPLPSAIQVFRVKVTSGQGVPFNEDIGRLQGEFIRKIDRHITTRGRQMVGWDEILEGGLKTGSRAVAMVWRGAGAVGGACGGGHEVIVALHPEYYLDNDTSLQRTYEYEPIPSGLPAGQTKHVLGVQGNMWGEQTQTMASIDRRSFPRLTAIAETGWTAAEHKDFADFMRRLEPLHRRLEFLGVQGGN